MSILEKGIYQFFGYTREGGEFLYSNKCISRFTESDADVLQELTGCAVATACNIFDILWVDDYPWWNFPG